jgi:hypothetical protein
MIPETTEIPAFAGMTAVGVEWPYPTPTRLTEIHETDKNI